MTISTISQPSQNTSKFLYEEIMPGIHLLANLLDREQCSIEIMYHSGGSYLESPEDRGKKHLLEHCIAARTRLMNHDEFKDWEFRENVSPNAYTGPIPMAVSISGYKGDFVKMIDWAMEVSVNPIFDQDDLDREKEIVLREIAERRGNPNYKLYYAVQDLMHTETSIERHQTLGNPKMVAQTTLEDFYRLHREVLETSHILIKVAGGGIDLDYIRTQFREIFSQATIEKKLEFKRLPINYQGFSELNQFDYLPVVNELAHEHCDLNFYIPMAITQENRAIRSIFHSLFMTYGGALYDRLRDEKRLVYHISSWADPENQMLGINMEAEIGLVDEITRETQDIFGDFETHFNFKRFQEFKDLIVKKQAMAKDKLTEAINYVQSTLTTYGTLETYDEYTEKLRQVTVEEMKEYYNQIRANWANKKVVVISKNPEITKLKF